VAGQIVLKVSNVKFNEKFSAVLHFVSCAQADGQTELFLYLFRRKWLSTEAVRLEMLLYEKRMSVLLASSARVVVNIYVHNSGSFHHQQQQQQQHSELITAFCS